MKREPGYYWVKFEGQWIIAEWYSYKGLYAHEDGGYFVTFFSEGSHSEGDFEEIDERRIERVENKVMKERIYRTCRDDGGPAFTMYLGDDQS